MSPSSTLSASWYLRPPTEQQPYCPCGAPVLGGLGCDHLWCDVHRTWSRDTGGGPSCCPRQAPTPSLPLAFAILDAALDRFGSVRSRGWAGIDMHCPRHPDDGEGVLISWSRPDLGRVDFITVCGCSPAEILDDLGVPA